MKRQYNLVIIAHPDDETIFFSGLIQRMRDLPWKIICVTDGNADHRKKSRLKEFETACIQLGVNDFELWNFPDKFEQRLDIDTLISKLKELPSPHQIFTHGIIGEYGHPHHQDISYAVHKYFHTTNEVFSISYNCYPEIVINLTKKEYQIKTNILSKIYTKEINRFANLVPGTSTETFSQVSFEELENIYLHITEKKILNKQKLSKYHWLAGHIETTLSGETKRLF